MNAVPLSQVTVPIGSQFLLTELSVADVDDDLVSIKLSTSAVHNDCTLYDVEEGTSGLDSITLTSAGGAFSNVATANIYLASKIGIQCGSLGNTDTITMTSTDNQGRADTDSFTIVAGSKIIHIILCTKSCSMRPSCPRIHAPEELTPFDMFVVEFDHIFSKTIAPEWSLDEPKWALSKMIKKIIATRKCT